MNRLYQRQLLQNKGKQAELAAVQAKVSSLKQHFSSTDRWNTDRNAVLTNDDVKMKRLRGLARSVPIRYVQNINCTCVAQSGAVQPMILTCLQTGISLRIDFQRSMEVQQGVFDSNSGDILQTSNIICACAHISNSN